MCVKIHFLDFYKGKIIFIPFPKRENVKGEFPPSLHFAPLTPSSPGKWSIGFIINKDYIFYLPVSLSYILLALHLGGKEKGLVCQFSKLQYYVCDIISSSILQLPNGFQFTITNSTIKKKNPCTYILMYCRFYIYKFLGVQSHFICIENFNKYSHILSPKFEAIFYQSHMSMCSFPFTLASFGCYEFIQLLQSRW